MARSGSYTAPKTSSWSAKRQQHKRSLPLVIDRGASAQHVKLYIRSTTSMWAFEDRDNRQEGRKHGEKEWAYFFFKVEYIENRFAPCSDPGRRPFASPSFPAEPLAWPLPLSLQLTATTQSPGLLASFSASQVESAQQKREQQPDYDIKCITDRVSKYRVLYVEAV